MTRQLVALIFVTLGLLGTLTTASAQICNPDSSETEVGVYPPTLPEGFVGQPYSTTITAVIPKRDTIPQGSFDICGAKILSAEDSAGTDLADLGLTFDCNFTDCEIIIDHSDPSPITYGCLVLEGTPTATLDSVTVNLTADLGSVTNGTCVTGLPNFPQSFTIAFPVSEEATSIEGAFSQTLTVAYLPSQQLQISIQGQRVNATQVNVIDMQGRSVVQVPVQQLQQGHEVVLMPTRGWVGGVYVVQLQDHEGQILLSEKVLVQP